MPKTLFLFLKLDLGLALVFTYRMSIPKLDADKMRLNAQHY